MTTQKDAITLKALIIILGLVVLGLGAYTYVVYDQLEASKEQLNLEKESLMVDLNAEIARYGSLLDEKKALNNQLIEARSQLEGLQKKLSETQLTRTLVDEYQRTLRQLRKEREELLVKNDSLVQENNRLEIENAVSQKKREAQLKAQKQSKDSLLSINTLLSSKLSQNRKLTIGEIDARGVIKRTSGKLLVTERAARVKMFQVCFTLPANALATQGDHVFYIQITDMNNKLIGVKKKVELPSGTSLDYSMRTVVNYEGNTRSLCELIIPVMKLTSGKYHIRLFTEDETTASTFVYLK